MMQETMKKIIFIALIIFVLFVAFALLQYQQFIFENAVWIALALAVLILLWKFDFLIMTKDYERAVIFRFGKTNRVGGPGWALVFPPIENYTVVDLRTETIDVAKQDVVTKDSIELKIDAVIYLRVKKDSPSVINSVVEVEDYKNAVRLYVISVLRDLIGGMDLTEVISEIETLNQSLKIKAEKISRDWGIQIEAAEIKDVEIPRTVMDAMH
ncbi:hypothetical protein KJ891_00940, partial [Candidatus Micrarchaeota archaeon]|nr:hypothetical protein [Candidatus Micrarchaeota archaeon]